MLFNLILIPFEIIIYLMIKTIKNDITKLHFESRVVQKQIEYLYNLDKGTIKSHNLRYILPPLKTNLFIFIIMSISTIVFHKEIYHLFIKAGFVVYFLVSFIFLALAKINMEKLRYKED